MSKSIQEPLTKRQPDPDLNKGNVPAPRSMPPRPQQAPQPQPQNPPTDKKTGGNR